MLRNQRHASILITGASSGLGEALALRYAAPSVVLHLLARNQQRLERVAEACASKGAVVHLSQVDVRDYDALHAAMLYHQALAPLDVIIVNAGISVGTGGEGGESASQARAIFETNTMGALNTICALQQVRSDARQVPCRVVLINSLAGLLPLSGAPAYAASKSALRYYLESARADLARTGIQLTNVYPGFIDTPLTRLNRFFMPQLMPAADAANIIHDAIACGKPRLYTPFLFSSAVRIIALLPFSWLVFLMCRLPKKQGYSGVL